MVLIHNLGVIISFYLVAYDKHKWYQSITSGNDFC